LWEVLWLSVCDCPSLVLNLESWFFLFLFLNWWLLLFFFFTFSSWLGNDWLWFWEFFILNLILLDVVFFRVELESNDSLDFSKILFNLEEFIHESQFKSVIIEDKLA